ncbi:MAG: hypothetical protein HYS38_06240 [Acidobacteria bacterium]|nr:hypothetical protein [Acidobacteriota bacterium]
MIPERRFLSLPKDFWSNVRTISEQIGYTIRGTGQIKVPSTQEIKPVFEKLGLSTAHLFTAGEQQTRLGETIRSYFEYRAHILNSFVEPHLMDAAQARREFRKLRKELTPTCPLPMNKQSGSKKAPAYLTCIVNMLIEANAHGLPCDYDPRHLTTVTSERGPLRTLARRVDGAFPRAVNPIAIWEVKEYYYTTTFGSRVADGVYETLLDGMELEELREHEGIEVKHYLMVDSHYTWWECGRSYLCRIIDMLHMGYVDEVLFGAEVMERLPSIVKEWVTISKERSR